MWISLTRGSTLESLMWNKILLVNQLSIIHSPSRLVRDSPVLNHRAETHLERSMLQMASFSLLADGRCVSGQLEDDGSTQSSASHRLALEF